MHMGLLALNLSVLGDGILIMVQQVRMMMFSMDYTISFLSLSTWILSWWTSRGEHSKMFLLFEFLCLTPPLCLIVRGWVVVGGLQLFSVTPSPLGTNWVFELFGTWFGLGQFIIQVYTKPVNHTSEKRQVYKL